MLKILNFKFNFYITQALLVNEKLPNLESVQVGGYRYAPYGCLRKMQARDRNDVTRLRQVNIPKVVV